MTNQEPIRLNKYISQTGMCSRREADKLLQDGRVSVNGTTAELGTKVGPEDTVAVDGKPISAKPKKNVYLAFNKPVGIVCTTSAKEKANIVDYINYPTRIFPIGRLDKASEGLILMTDDGDIVNKILRSRNNHGKEYIVKVDRQVSDDFIQRMSNGIPILDTITKKCEVERLSKFIFRIVLTQGLNRQIRRMCEYLGYEVIQLKRVRVLNINLDIGVGQYRPLTEKELEELNSLVQTSSSVHEDPTHFAPEKEVSPEPKKTRFPTKEKRSPTQRKNPKS